jgi:hypothetical protein
MDRRVDLDLDLDHDLDLPDDNVDDDGRRRREEEGRETMVRRYADVGAKEKAATLPTKGGRNGENDDGGMAAAAARAAAATTTTTSIAGSDDGGGGGGDDDGLPRRILRLRLLFVGESNRDDDAAGDIMEGASMGGVGCYRIVSILSLEVECIMLARRCHTTFSYFGWCCRNKILWGFWRARGFIWRGRACIASQAM